jgi:RecB family exonuclease
MLQVEGHHDFAVLEDRLADLIRGVKESDPAGAFAPVAVVVPSDRLRDHLQIVLAEKLGAVLGVTILTHEVLAREAARAAGAARPRALSARVLETILAEALEAIGGGLAAYAGARPGSVATLLATIGDLRESGVSPEAALKASGVSPRGRESLKLYAAYAARLDRLAGHGVTDRAGSLRAALPHVPAFASHFRLVVHYGAYELIGANLELMRAAESSGVRTVYLMPWHATSPAFAYARSFASDTLRVEPVSLPGIRGGDPPRDGARLLGDRLPALYDEEAAPAPMDRPSALELFHAQGAAAELREAALRILDLQRRRKIPLTRVGIIARSLEPYAAILRPVLEAHRLAFTTRASQGALREARALAALHLARAVLGGYERQPLMDLFRSGLWKPKDVAGEAHAWDGLSREWQVTRGSRAWTEDLPRWVGRWEPYVPEDAGEPARDEAMRLAAMRRGQAAALGRAVEALLAAARPVEEAATWTSWSEAMAALLRASLHGFDAAGEETAGGVAAVLGVLAEMRDLDLASIPFYRGDALARFERGLKETRVRVISSGAGGVQVLDAMQARGVAFDAVFLLGFNADLFPRRSREDPFLGDADRRRIGATLPIPLRLASRSIEEEHLLLAHILGAARRTITVSWQRADDAGRAKVPSLALREIARILSGDPRLATLHERAFRVAAHPADAARSAVDRFGALPPLEAAWGAALSLRSPRAVLDAAHALPRSSEEPSHEAGAMLASGLTMLAAVEELSPAVLDYDARVAGAPALPEEWSPSRLETLGACPQQYFFRHILHVDELEEVAEEHEIDAREIGLRVHGVLHDVYRNLIDAGDLSSPGADPSAAADKAKGLVERAWDDHTRDLRERMRSRYPILWEATSRLWRNALETFLLHDVAAMVRDGGHIVGLEHAVRASLDLGAGGRTLKIRGRFDRVSRRGADAVIVADYKTGSGLEKFVSIRDALKGLRLQLPLYVLMAEAQLAAWRQEGAEVGAEAIGVGPAHVGGDRSPSAEGGAASRVALDAAKLAACREGFLETLRVLVDLAASGLFPLNERTEHCRFCPFTRACRKSHAPTRARLAAAGEAKDYYLLAGKSTKSRTLADVSPAGDGDEEPS